MEAMITGLRPDTFNNLQLDAGVILENFDLDTPKTVQELKDAVVEALKQNTGVIGATRGSGTFRAVPVTRGIEVNGLRYQYKGGTVTDSWDIRLSITLLEITARNFKRALISADIEKTDNSEKTVVRLRTATKDDDYIPKICWIGNTSKGYMAIELINALNTAGANFTFIDRGEGTIPLDLVAHQDSFENAEYAPFKAVFFNANGAQAAAIDETEGGEAE